ncbi:unnamed protein product [Arabidopsis halleri]
MLEETLIGKQFKGFKKKKKKKNLRDLYDSGYGNE